MSMCVVVVLIVRMRTGHGVGGEGGEVIAAIVIGVTVIRVMARVVVRVVRRQGALSLDLGGSGGKEVDVETMAVVGASSLTSMAVGVKSRGNVGSICCEGVWR